MKRRSVLQSIIALPAIAAARATQKDLPAAKQQGLPAGPPLVPPGRNETPNTPVVPADETAAAISRTFNPDQLSALTNLGDLIVPSRNNCPGATQAGAAEFLDFLIGCSPNSRLELYRNGLDALNHAAEQKFGKSFGMLTSVQADAFLSPLREPWSFRRANDDTVPAFLQAVKGDLLRATFNSRPYIDALSQTRRPRNASDFYWRTIE